MRRLRVDSRIASKGGLVTRKTTPGLEAWNFQPHLNPLRRRDWVNKRWPTWWSLHKNAWTMESRELPDWRTHPCARRVTAHPSSLGTADPVLETLRDLTLCTSLHLAFICILNNILYNKSVNMFPWVLWAITVNYWTEGRGHCNPQFVAEVDRSVVIPGTHYLQLASAVGTVC